MIRSWTKLISYKAELGTHVYPTLELDNYMTLLGCPFNLWTFKGVSALVSVTCWKDGVVNNEDTSPSCLVGSLLPLLFTTYWSKVCFLIGHWKVEPSFFTTLFNPNYSERRKPDNQDSLFLFILLSSLNCAPRYMPTKHWLSLCIFVSLFHSLAYLFKVCEYKILL